MSTRESEQCKQDPDELEAEGHEDISRGHTKLAQAAKLRTSKVYPVPDEIVNAKAWAEFGFKSERAMADALRDKITSFRAGHGRAAFRKDVLAYLESRTRAPKAKAIAPDDSTTAAYLRLVNGGGE